MLLLTFSRSKALKEVIGKTKKMLEEIGVCKGEKQKVDGGNAGSVKEELDDIKQEDKMDELKEQNQ